MKMNFASFHSDWGTFSLCWLPNYQAHDDRPNRTDLGSPVNPSQPLDVIVGLVLPSKSGDEVKFRLLTLIQQINRGVQLKVGQTRLQSKTQRIAQGIECSEIQPKKVSTQVSQIVTQIRLHLRGDPQDFSKVQVAVLGCTQFQKKVYQHTHKLKLGQTTTYSKLATIVGSPNGARAVGTALSKNPVPLLIPCHRIMGADQSLKGFTAPNGIIAKASLLRIEGHTRWS